MRILCPAGNVLHTDAAFAVAIEFLPVLSNSLEPIDDKQIRVSTDADFIVSPDIWNDWSYSLALANRLVIRISALPGVDKIAVDKGTDKLMALFGEDINKLFTASLSELSPLLEQLHHNIDKALNTFITDDLIAISKKDVLVIGNTREQLIKDGLYSDEYEQFFDVVPKPYLRLELSDKPGKFFDLYLPHDEEQMDAFYQIVNNSEIQLVAHDNDEVADFVVDTVRLIDWFNDVFSFYRLKLKIETYREIKFVEKDNEEFVSQIENFDELIRGTSEENESSSDKHYFLLNKISGILNAFGYEQEILHAVTDIEDFGESENGAGYFMHLV
ncbi:hypothetical protein MUB04_14245 [Acinetobacter indicus]|uniref:hypothetical protein n=1 Tax=Acinetobacter TaxID=469 RepID=UPI0015D3253B|nr:MULTISPECIES: hypothetical protein [Acinetobacter]MCP0917691.1 hypothetical protein [Acinetobacter indicus]